MKMIFTTSILVMAWSLSLVPALASDGKVDHSKMDHSKMGHGQMKATEGNKAAVAVGVINSVDASAGKINVTHEPVPALGWPKMTMDLPVTRRVDLSTVKPGSTVNITLKQGRDKQFRVMAIEPKK